MMQQYRLEMKNLDEAGLTQRVDGAKNLGYRFSSLAELEWLPVYELHQICRKLQPPVETRQEPQDLGRWKSIWLEDPDLYHVLIAGEAPIAVCGLHRTESPGELECGFTGILPEFAGRGLSGAVKSSALLAAKARGIVAVRTQTHEDNDAMNAINDRLGFQPTA